MQTKIIEINLMFKPEVADAILSGGQFSHYDRPRIAQLCEKAGLYMRAMEHYNDLADIRRVMANTHAIPPVRPAAPASATHLLTPFTQVFARSLSRLDAPNRPGFVDLVSTG